MPWLPLLLLALLLPLSGCGDSAGGGAVSRCTPNATQVCDCVVDGDLSQGVQTCESDGNAWTLCDCGQTPADTSGGGGGAGSDAGSMTSPDTTPAPDAMGPTDTAQPVEPGPCEGSPCLNGGNCIEADAAFTCECAVGFEGELCDVNIDDCDPSPCLNGGLCVDGANAFTCECVDGYEGALCESPPPLPTVDAPCGPQFEDITWSTGTRYIVGCDLQLAAGATLTIEPGTEVAFDGSWEILVQGAIVADGSADSPILFTTTAGVPLPGTRFITFSDTDLSLSSVAYAHMEYAEYAIKAGPEGFSSDDPIDAESITGVLIINNTVFEETGVLLNAAASMAVTNSTLTSVKFEVENEVFFSDAGTVSFSGSTLDAVDFEAWLGPTVMNSTSITNSSLDQRRDELFMDEVVVTDSVVCNTTDTTEISHSTLTNAWLNMDEITIESSVVSWETKPSVSGWYCSAYAEPLRANDMKLSLSTFSGAGGVGIVLEYPRDNDSIESCELSGFDIAIRIESEGQSTPEFSGNSFHSNATYAIENLSPQDIDASGNWWGTSDSDAIADLIHDYYDDLNLGAVDTSGALSSAPETGPTDP